MSAPARAHGIQTEAPRQWGRGATIATTRPRRRRGGATDLTLAESAVTVTIAPDLINMGDRRLLESVMENLLSNAWKYSRHNKGAEISFTSEQVGDRTVYVVRDNGAGFDMNYLDRLFMPFCRLHRSEEFEGTGIGLATVLRILARQGGRIWGEGAIGKGAVFRFTLWEGEGADGKP